MIFNSVKLLCKPLFTIGFGCWLMACNDTKMLIRYASSHQVQLASLLHLITPCGTRFFQRPPQSLTGGLFITTNAKLFNCFHRSMCVERGYSSLMNVCCHLLSSLQANSIITHCSVLLLWALRSSRVYASIVIHLI